MDDGSILAVSRLLALGLDWCFQNTEHLYPRTLPHLRRRLAVESLSIGFRAGPGRWCVFHVRPLLAKLFEFGL